MQGTLSSKMPIVMRYDIDIIFAFHKSSMYKIIFKLSISTINKLALSNAKSWLAKDVLWILRTSIPSIIAALLFSMAAT